MNNVRPIGFRGTIFAALVASVLLAANAQAGEAEGLHYDERAAGTATYFAAISNLANAIMFSGLGEELIVSPYERDDWLRRTRFPWTRNWLNLTASEIDSEFVQHVVGEAKSLYQMLGEVR